MAGTTRKRERKVIQVNWEDEPWVKLYKNNSTAVSMLSVEARGVLWELLRIVDDAGVIRVGKFGARGLAARLGTTEEKASAWLNEWLDAEVVVEGDECFVVAKFVEAQSAKANGAARTRASRAKRRALALAYKEGILSEVQGEEKSRDATSHDETPTATRRNAERRDEPNRIEYSTLGPPSSFAIAHSEGGRAGRAPALSESEDEPEVVEIRDERDAEAPVTQIRGDDAPDEPSALRIDSSDFVESDSATQESLFAECDIKSPKTSPVDESKARKGRAKKKRRAPTDPNRAAFIEHFHTRFKQATGSAPTWGPRQLGHVKTLLSRCSDLSELKQRANRMFDIAPKFPAEHPDLATLVAHWDKFVALKESAKRDVTVGHVKAKEAHEYPPAGTPEPGW